MPIKKVLYASNVSQIKLSDKDFVVLVYLSLDQSISTFSSSYDFTTPFTLGFTSFCNVSVFITNFWIS